MAKVKLLRGTHRYRAKDGRMVVAHVGETVDMTDAQAKNHGPMRVEKVATGPGRPRKTETGTASASLAVSDGSAEG